MDLGTIQGTEIKIACASSAEDKTHLSLVLHAIEHLRG